MRRLPGPDDLAAEHDETDDAPAPPMISEIGNARLLAEVHGDELCHVPGLGWHCWDEHRWAYDDMGEVDRRLKQIIDGLRHLVFAPGDAKTQSKLLAEWRAAHRHSHVVGALAEAETEPGMRIRVAELDRDPWALNATNGTLDLRTGELSPHDPVDLITKLAPAAYHPDAPCPRFERFLEEIFAGDDELIAYVQRAAGYSLTGLVDEHFLPVCHGNGANGKSTLINVLRRVLGDYAVQLAPDLLLATKQPQHPTGLMDLRGARFAATIEVEQGRRLAEALVKALTGGENVRARRMRQDFVEFAPTHKLWLVVNHLPQVRGADEGIWRRIHVVPFTVTIAEDQRDTTLPEKLWAERAGILRWLVAGTHAWADRGLDPPDAVRSASARYREEQDHLGAFVAACCDVADHHRVAVKELRPAYEAWCAAAQEEPLGRTLWGRLLNERGFTADRSRHHRTGLSLRTDTLFDSPLTSDNTNSARSTRSAPFHATRARA